MIIFKQNKYTSLYFKLIEARKNRLLDSNQDYEKHHIIPKCLGGKNSNDNMISLTYREHFLAHWLLTKMCVNLNEEIKMKYAFNCLTTLKNENHKRITTSWQFAIARKHNKEANKMGKSNKGSKWNEQSKINLSNSLKGNTRRLNTTHSEESKLKMRERKLGVSLSEETKIKMSKSKIGVNKSFETRLAMSNSQKAIPPVKCPHCNKSGHYAAMVRWHFNNCKINKTEIKV
jgi:hypothetical protein